MKKVIFLFLFILVSFGCFAQNKISTGFIFFPRDKARWDGEAVTVQKWFKLNDFQKTKFISEYLEELKKEYKQNIEIDIPKYVQWLNSFANEKKDTDSDYKMTMVFKTYLLLEEKIPYIKSVHNIIGIAGTMPEYNIGYEDGYSGLPRSGSSEEYDRGYKDGERDYLERAQQEK